MRAALATAAVLCGCAADLREDFPFDGELPDGTYVEHEVDGELVTTRVDASQKNAWVYLDLDTREHVPASAAVGTAEWDLAFQRFKILSNSGVSGTGATQVAPLLDADFDAVGEAPAEGYLADQADGPDGNEDIDSAFLIDDGWYYYDLLVHQLSPRSNVYVVRTAGGYFKLQMLGYYDRAGSAAHLSFRWARVAAPQR